MKKQGCFYPGIYVGAGVVFFRGAVMNTGDVLAPGDLPQNGVVTTEGVVHVYRVAEKGGLPRGGDKRRGDSGVVFSVSPPEWKRIAGGISETSVVYSGYFLNTRSG
ncbi:hypothetical protein EA552_24525 [Salmonella enterica]|nr:hypothetical protein [Salmonella enterica subsp. enterica serovar Minnesota]